MANTLLPNEITICEKIQTSLSSELGTCAELLAFGIDLPSNGNNLCVHSLRSDTVTTAIGLFVKATTSFRAVIHLCEVGLERSASPVSRSLFETALNLTFLLRRHVSLFQFHGNNPKTELDLDGKKLTTGFRTDLHNAWCILRSRKNAEAWAKTPGIKRMGKQALKRINALNSSYLDSIGPCWEKRIRKTSTCVGLSIADFAASIDRNFYIWYRTVYASESQSAHSSDMASFLDLSADQNDNFTPRWHTSSDEIRKTLRRAATMYLCCTEELNKRFQFGHNAKLKIKQFGEGLRKMAQ